MLKDCEANCQDCYWYADGIGCTHPDGDKFVCDGFIPYRVHQFPFIIDEASFSPRRPFHTSAERKLQHILSMFSRPTKKEDDLE